MVRARYSAMTGPNSISAGEMVHPSGTALRFGDPHQFDCSKVKVKVEVNEKEKRREQSRGEQSRAEQSEGEEQSFHTDCDAAGTKNSTPCCASCPRSALLRCAHLGRKGVKHPLDVVTVRH